MSASAMFAAELEALGIWWPEGDGDALRVSADGWLAAADLIEDIGRVLDVAASMVVENHRGEAAARFAALWADWTGPTGYVAVTVADCRRIAAALQDFGTDIDVADRALLRLIEEAPGAQIAPTLLLLDELWRIWLADGAEAIGAELAARADAASTPLAGVATGPILSADERGAIDPSLLTWPDLTPPTDLSHLAVTLVDLGAGQGELPVDVPVPVEPPDPAGPLPDDGLGLPPVPTTPSFPSFPAGGGVTIVVNGDGNTITVETPSYAAPSFDTSVDPLPDLAPASMDAFTAGYEPGFATGGFDVAPGIASAPARLAELDAVGVHDAWRRDTGAPTAPVTPVTTPIVIDPPGSALAGAAAAGTTAAAAAARSGRAPFFPFMPMGGGMTGGDESPEPKRRVTKKRRLAG